MVYQQYFYLVKALKLIDYAVVSFDQFPYTVVVFFGNNPTYFRHCFQNINFIKKF
ncbi:hypothetical protein C943_00428 [Mariniradius saccharolyticus AK6]|uniref:Uncharacterized protein n=1 Tax=Mariniradius saccharolyticus AK6 TaxID=1239962 RepID=M7Y7E0_9BACT|nr:hypothetical protein C943_00428 [Mariniradius saccharolyticus AK6]